jgi:hypothetical protein
MQVGDLVENLNSETGLMGIIVGWFGGMHSPCPVVHWNNGRVDWILPHLIKVVV